MVIYETIIFALNFKILSFSKEKIKRIYALKFKHCSIFMKSPSFNKGEYSLKIARTIKPSSYPQRAVVFVDGHPVDCRCSIRSKLKSKIHRVAVNNSHWTPLVSMIQKKNQMLYSFTILDDGFKFS